MRLMAREVSEKPPAVKKRCFAGLKLERVQRFGAQTPGVALTMPRKVYDAAGKFGAQVFAQRPFAFCLTHGVIKGFADRANDRGRQMIEVRDLGIQHPFLPCGKDGSFRPLLAHAS
jgi:hypothetical protein